MSSWRYQVIWREVDDGRHYSICEVYFDNDGHLESWTLVPEIWPGGDGHESLLDDIIRMYVDCVRWAPVAFDALYVGMEFEELISDAEKEMVAEMLQGIHR